MPPDMQTERGYPDMLQHFHSLYPLDASKSTEDQASRALGVRSTVLKGVSGHDGSASAIRRFGSRQVRIGSRAKYSKLTRPVSWLFPWVSIIGPAKYSQEMPGICA